MVQHATLFTEGGAYPAGELREIVGGGKQLERQFPLSVVDCVLPFGGLVAQRAGPVAEWHSAIHTAGCLQAAFALVEELFHFTEVADPLIYRSVSRFLAGYSQKCLRISHCQ